MVMGSIGIAVAGWGGLGNTRAKRRGRRGERGLSMAVKRTGARRSSPQGSNRLPPVANRSATGSVGETLAGSARG